MVHAVALPADFSPAGHAGGVEHGRFIRAFCPGRAEPIKFSGVGGGNENCIVDVQQPHRFGIVSLRDER